MSNLMVRLRYAFVILFVMMAIMSGCSSSKNRVGSALNLDTDLRLNFIVDSDINPDENKRPSPVFVRLYELKTTDVFKKADFLDLYERDKDILGADLLGKQTLKPLAPGINRTDNLVLKGGASQVALYAEFSQYRGSTYKVTFPITLNNMTRNEVTIKISGTNIAIIKNK